MTARKWFAELPIRRRFAAIAVIVATGALVLATAALTVVDFYRNRRSIENDTDSLASVIAENAAAAVVFQDQADAERTLAAVRIRPTVQRACLYLEDGRLFAGFAPPAGAACPSELPTSRDLASVISTADVSRNGRRVGTVYIERDVGELWPRLASTALVDTVTLAVIGFVAVLLANRLQRSVSEPIADLAEAARGIHVDTVDPALPAIDSHVGEIGDLSRALSGMLRRLADANAQLRQRDAEREDLLTREREANRLKDDFLAAVSHELRTPLNAIVGWSQILTTTSVTKDALEKGLASIERNARTQARLIGDLVDVSRIATGKLTLKLAPVDLRDVAASAVDVIRPGARSKRLHITVATPDAPCLVEGDRDRLLQVMSNLLSNALKFTAEGDHIDVVVRPGDGQYEIDVVDTGAGIAASFLPFVFDRFRQADGSLTREHGGLGLGLSIVKQITELHGGTVSASSAGPGHGAAFTVRLPALAGPLTAPSPPAPAAVEPPAVLTGLRVLIADDSADASEVLATLLTPAGAVVRVVNSGDRAIAEYLREPPDLLLCDLAMPGTDGFAVLRRIREHEGASDRHTPAISVSAHAGADYVARSRRAGFAGHVAKPFRVDDLFRAIASAMSAKVSGSTP